MGRMTTHIWYGKKKMFETTNQWCIGSIDKRSRIWSRHFWKLIGWESQPRLMWGFFYRCCSCFLYRQIKIFNTKRIQMVVPVLCWAPVRWNHCRRCWCLLLHLDGIAGGPKHVQTQSILRFPQKMGKIQSLNPSKIQQNGRMCSIITKDLCTFQFSHIDLVHLYMFFPPKFLGSSSRKLHQHQFENLDKSNISQSSWKNPGRLNIFVPGYMLQLKHT